MKITGQAAAKQGAKLGEFSYAPKTLGSHDVRLSITHCGICHSDVHLIDNDWGISSYPFIPGHEIVGTVAEVGSAITHLKPGDRAGIGWQCGSCMECEYCLAGDENFCEKQKATCVGNHGGFADGVVADGRFTFKIPDALPSEQAAPLLCGGITVFNPLRHHNVGKGTRAGIIGIGGLGHMAIQFAAALGADVTALSGSADKEQEARSLGANHFLHTTPENLKKHHRHFDFLLCTVSADLNWLAYIDTLRPHGKFCLVGAAPNPVAIPSFQLIGTACEISGNPIGSRARIQEMLEFAAKHKIGAITESFPLADVNKALDKVRSGKLRYRAVLNIA